MNELLSIYHDLILPFSAFFGSLLLWAVIYSSLKVWTRRHQGDEARLFVDLLQQIRILTLAIVILIGLRIALEVIEESIFSPKYNLAIKHLLGILIIIGGLRISLRSLRVVMSSSWIHSRVNLNARVILKFIFKIIFFLISLLLILQQLGISITPILASLGVGSIAVALALQDTLGNLFSGFYLLADQPVRLGDYIRVDKEIEGRVSRIGWRSSQLLTSNGEMIVLPNSKLSTSIITNFNLHQTSFHLSIHGRVAYSIDLERVEKIILEVAKDVVQTTEGADRQHDPSMKFQRFGEYAIEFSVSLRSQTQDRISFLRHEFIKALHKRFQNEGIEIPLSSTVLVSKVDALSTSI